MAGHQVKPLPVISQSDKDRFWAKVDKRGPNECWPWTAAKAKHGGYGVMMFGHSDLCKASRVSYAIHHGIDAFDKHIRHTCDNPVCCNPAHLEPGTHAENMNDMKVRGRAMIASTKRARGEDHHASKLTDEECDYIRRVYKKGRGPTGALALAKKFNVSRQTIYDIVKGKWRKKHEDPNDGLFHE